MWIISCCSSCLPASHLTGNSAGLQVDTVLFKSSPKDPGNWTIPKTSYRGEVLTEKRKSKVRYFLTESGSIQKVYYNVLYNWSIIVNIFICPAYGWNFVIDRYAYNKHSVYRIQAIPSLGYLLESLEWNPLWLWKNLCYWFPDSLEYPTFSQRYCFSILKS